ncbi:hypothetical protein [Azospirillum sp. Marseille-Q6669]
MTDTDWALVVGLGNYPALGGLDGPENDVQDFAGWLIDGAGVPDCRIRRVLSSQHPPAQSAANAKPAEEEIIRFFDEMGDLAEANEAAGKGFRVGRRLYLYLSGHGFAAGLEDAALLTANATQFRVNHHVLGRSWADWFYRAGVFDEVLLFMDCCREAYRRPPLNLATFPEMNGPDVTTRGRRFYGFATKWSRAARERMMPDGKIHGVFTTALLEGLRGAAAHPQTGEVTAATLKSYLYNNMQHFLSEGDRKDPDLAKEPDLFFSGCDDTAYVIVKVPVPDFPVQIAVREPLVGQPLRIFDSALQEVDSTAAAEALWNVRLKRGNYMILGPGGREAMFEVSGVTLMADAGGPHVQV